MDPTDSLILTLPRDVGIETASLACRVTNFEAECFYSETEHAVTIVGLCAVPTEVKDIGQYVYIDGLLNPSSTRPLAQFTFNLVDQKKRVVVKGDKLVWQTKKPALLPVTLFQASTKPLLASPYIFKPVAKGDTLRSSYVKLTFPTCMSFSEPAKTSLKVQDGSGLALATTFKSSAELIISRPEAPIDVIMLKDIVNPTEQCLLQSASVILVETFADSDLSFIQGTFSVQPSLGCDDNCLSCSLNDKSVCTQCVADHFLTSDAKCVSSCPPGAVGNQTTQTC